LAGAAKFCRKNAAAFLCPAAQALRFARRGAPGKTRRSLHIKAGGSFRSAGSVLPRKPAQRPAL